MNNETREYLQREADYIRAFARATGVRPDWHEPDEQNVTATVTGDRLDNAGTKDEINVTVDGPNNRIVVSLATLLAIATDYARYLDV